MDKYLLRDGSGRPVLILEAKSRADVDAVMARYSQGVPFSIGGPTEVQSALDELMSRARAAWTALGVSEDVASRGRNLVAPPLLETVRVPDQQPVASSSGSNVQVSEQARRIREAVNREVQPILASIRALRTPITEQQRQQTPAGSVELRETDAQFEEEAVRAWQTLGFSREAAERAARGEL